jgi:hypothetical protein
VRVDDERGCWIPDGGRLRSQPGEAERLPGGALLWEREGRTLLMRIELSKEEAIRIAESVRQGRASPGTDLGLALYTG